MKPGDLVRWSGPRGENDAVGDAGIVVEIGSHIGLESTATVMWEDGCAYYSVRIRWLEVINEARRPHQGEGGLR